MSSWARHRTQWARLGALVAPLVVSVALVPFRGSFTDAAAALVLGVVIVAVAAVGDRLAGVVASLSAAVWFDFFLTKPYGQLAINQRADLETTVGLLIAGVVV